MHRGIFKKSQSKDFFQSRVQLFSGLYGVLGDKIFNGNVNIDKLIRIRHATSLEKRFSVIIRLIIRDSMYYVCLFGDRVPTACAASGVHAIQHLIFHAL